MTQETQIHKSEYAPAIVEEKWFSNADDSLLRDFFSKGFKAFSLPMKNKVAVATAGCVIPVALAIFHAMVPSAPIPSPEQIMSQGNVASVSAQDAHVLTMPEYKIPRNDTDVYNQALNEIRRQNILEAERHVYESLDQLPSDLDKREMNPELFKKVITASKNAGVNPAVMLAFAKIESHMEPGIHVIGGKGSAQGLFQFTSPTWIECMYRYGEKYNIKAAQAITRDKDFKYHIKSDADRKYILSMRNNPVIATYMAAEMIKDSISYIESATNQKLNVSDYYLPHFMGADGAKNFIQQERVRPNAIGAVVAPRAAKYNKGRFYTKEGKALTAHQVRKDAQDIFGGYFDRYTKMLSMGENKLFHALDKARSGVETAKNEITQQHTKKM